MPRRPRRLPRVLLASAVAAAVAATGVAAGGVATAAAAGTAAPGAVTWNAPTSGTTTSGRRSTSRVDPAYVRTAADKRISSYLTTRATTTRFGSAFSGAVMDAGSNTLVWARNGDTALMPASTTKLVTASNALTTFGPAHRFTTTVRQGSAANRVVLVGSGDPTLTSAAVDRLAAATATSVRARGITSVRVYADDYLFPAPSLAYGWKSTYVPTDITPVRALVRSQRDVTDTTVDAATYFRDRLKAHGVTATYAGRTRAAAGAATLASSAGFRLDTIVGQMLLDSDNEHAEALHKLVGLRLGVGASWAGAAKAQRARMASRGLAMTALYDGSGLSRADRLTAVQLARVVDAAFDARNTTALAPLRSTSAMPTAGQTGTLKASYGRFVTAQSKCAVGKVYAKTGSLTDAASLSGWTLGTDGRVKTFAFVVNGRSNTPDAQAEPRHAGSHGQRLLLTGRSPAAPPEAVPPAGPTPRPPSSHAAASRTAPAAGVNCCPASATPLRSSGSAKPAQATMVSPATASRAAARPHRTDADPARAAAALSTGPNSTTRPAVTTAAATSQSGFSAHQRAEPMAGSGRPSR